MQLIHLESHDGSVDHVEFNRSTWEQFVSDPSIRRRWTHLPNDCHDSDARFFAERRRSGFSHHLNKRQHDLADLDDPNWIGYRGHVEVPKEPESEPIIWPPDGELTLWQLRALTTMCREDAMRCLNARLLEPIKQEDLSPKIGKAGQMSLF